MPSKAGVLYWLASITMLPISYAFNMLSSPRGPFIACIPGYAFACKTGEIYLLYESLKAFELLIPDFNILIPSKTGFYPGK